MRHGEGEEDVDLGRARAAATGVLRREHDEGAVLGPLVLIDELGRAVGEHLVELTVAVPVLADAVIKDEQRVEFAAAVAGRGVLEEAGGGVGGAERDLLLMRRARRWSRRWWRW